VAERHVLQGAYAKVPAAGLVQQVFARQPLEQVGVPVRGELLGQVFWGRDVQGDVGEGRLAPARGDVQVVYELPDGLFDLGIGQVIAEYVRGEVGIKAAERLGAGPLGLQNAHEVGHLAQGLAEMPWRAGGHATRHAVEALVEQGAQAPPRAVAREAVQVVDMVGPGAVRAALFCGVDCVQPEVCDDLSGDVVDEARVGVPRVRVGLDSPVRAGDILRDGGGAVYVCGTVAVQGDDVALFGLSVA
jgi:hypothetical protein